MVISSHFGLDTFTSAENEDGAGDVDGNGDANTAKDNDTVAEAGRPGRRGGNRGRRDETHQQRVPAWTK